MKLGRTIIKKTPLALFARKSGLSYKEIAECTGQSESTLKKAGAGILRLPPKAALAIANRFDVALPFLLGETKAKTVVHADGDEWHPLGGSVQRTVSGYSKEHHRLAVIKAIEECANRINYRLPKEDDQKASLGYAIRWFNPYSADDDINAMKTDTENRKRMQRCARELKTMYALWERVNEGAYPKAERVALPAYFEQQFQFFIQDYPRVARKDLLTRFETLLVEAGSHPQSPLIAAEILRFFIDIERRYKISRQRS